MGLSNNPTCRRCGSERKPQSTFCECETLASLRHALVISLFLEPEDFTELIIGAIWNAGKETELL